MDAKDKAIFLGVSTVLEVESNGPLKNLLSLRSIPVSPY